MGGFDSRGLDLMLGQVGYQSRDFICHQSWTLPDRTHWPYVYCSINFDLGISLNQLFIGQNCVFIPGRMVQVRIMLLVSKTRKKCKSLVAYVLIFWALNTSPLIHYLCEWGGRLYQWLRVYTNSYKLEIN